MTRPVSRSDFLAAALWLIALAWVFAVAAWELPDLTDEAPPIYAAGGDNP